MSIGRLELLALFLELTNEATVVAETLDDPFLTATVGAAALAAGERLGLSHAQVCAMQSDMVEMRMGGSPGLRISPDLEGPSTATVVATTPRPRVHRE